MNLFRRDTLPETIEAGGRTVALVAARHPAARGVRLRADPAAGVLRLTLPPRGGTREAVRLVADNRDWIAGQVTRWPQPLPFVHGAVIPFDGGRLTLDWSPDHARAARRDGDLLLLGGAIETLAPRTLRWLRAAALTDLDIATRAMAVQIERPVTKISVGDPRGRWGSCVSRHGRIAYSWRLILAPGWVRASVVAHEAAHLVHADHGRGFHALLAELDPRAGEARRWLKAHGAALHWVGRSA